MASSRTASAEAQVLTLPTPAAANCLAVRWIYAMKNLYKTGISIDKTYVYARDFRVTYTLEIAQTLARELVTLGEKLDVLGCLIDLRGTTSVSSVVDKHNFAYEKATVAGLPRHWRYAFIKDHGDDSLNFIETVMKNAGYMFQIFEEDNEAVDWIKGELST